VPPVFAQSASPVSLYLRSLTLNASFDWGLPCPCGPGGVWTGPREGATNEVYLVTVAWDLSGRPPIVYPPAASGLDPARLTRAMRVGDRLELVGDGLAVWPSARVTGGLFANVFVMESDSSSRALGVTLARVTELVARSPLADALTRLAGPSPDGAVAAALGQAALALVGSVAVALQDDGDDLVGVFYGTYGVERLASRLDRYDDRGASIELALEPARGVDRGAHTPPRPPPGRLLE
jgi:hypothetical protein